MGLPLGLPFVAFTQPGRLVDKLPDVIRYVGERPLGRVDDALGPEVRAWAASRQAPTLLVETDRRVGLTREHIERLRAFAARMPK